MKRTVTKAKTSIRIGPDLAAKGFAQKVIMMEAPISIGKDCLGRRIDKI